VNGAINQGTMQVALEVWEQLEVREQSLVSTYESTESTQYFTAILAGVHRF
jgi:hypothetical protein